MKKLLLLAVIAGSVLLPGCCEQECAAPKAKKAAPAKRKAAPKKAKKKKPAKKKAPKKRAAKKKKAKKHAYKELNNFDGEINPFEHAAA